MQQLDRAWSRVAAAAVLLFERMLRWEVDVRGLERVPTAGGAILAFNHHSYVDVVMLAWGPVLRLARPVRFLAKAELFRHWATRRLVTSVGCVPVERGTSGTTSRMEAYRAAVHALQDGELVAVAPEQTISDSYELLPFKLGPARLAIESGAPLVPTIGWGSHRAAPRGRALRPRRHLPVVVQYGEPIAPRPGEDAEALTVRLRAAMTELLDEVQRSYPDRPTAGDDWWVPARLGGSAPPHAEVLARHEARFAHRQRRDGTRAEGPDVGAEDRAS